jgi:GT2 family glycosyltransferase
MLPSHHFLRRINRWICDLIIRFKRLIDPRAFIGNPPYSRTMEQSNLKRADKAFLADDIDAIILNYRVGALAAGAAHSAKESGIKSILIVDNHSGDDSVSILERHISAFAEILPLPENIGFSSGNNAGAKRTRKPLILFLNADASLEPGAMQQMIDAMYANPSIGVICPSLYGPKEEPQASAYLLLGPLRILNMLLGLNKIGKLIKCQLLAGNADLKHNDEYTGFIQSAYGACMLVRRNAFESVNGFDEDFFLYCEETDLCLRMQIAGWKIYRCGKARVKHWHGQSANKTVRKSLILMSESHKLYARKHFSFIGRATTMLAFVTGLILRILLARSWEGKTNCFAALGVWLGWTPSVDPRKQ